MLARDAQLSGDRVAAENFLQHSEHYTRLLSDAQREQNQRREAHEAQQQAQRRDHSNGEAAPELQNAEQPETGAAPLDARGAAESGLVETPEGNSKTKPAGGAEPEQAAE